MLPAPNFIVHTYLKRTRKRALRVVSSRYAINKPSSVDVNAESRPHVLVSNSLKTLRDIFVNSIFKYKRTLLYLYFQSKHTSPFVERLFLAVIVQSSQPETFVVNARIVKEKNEKS